MGAVEQIASIAEQALKELQEEIASLEFQIEQLINKKKLAETKMKSLRMFIETNSGKTSAISLPENQVEELLDDPEEVFADMKPLSGKELSNAIEEVLREALPNPLHYEEIIKRLNSKGIRVPGNQARNIMNYLVRDQRFIRVKKGTYTIKPENDVTDVNNESPYLPEGVDEKSEVIQQ
ncbi:hypothetical protein E308F_25420 [Moorella sp. E308F]|uniref:HTH domain-containing protein n=1 Tax=Moorella sp. E308F TaxID=2572682 RepID=UPI0010FFAB9F|nr:HTH domain-containing protein [Moorella sp. E308F]GEA16298.1 hypothetical protein E308F_25420 [Moorella sp. E308F]